MSLSISEILNKTEKLNVATLTEPSDFMQLDSFIAELLNSPDASNKTKAFELQQKLMSNPQYQNYLNQQAIAQEQKITQQEEKIDKTAVEQRRVAGASNTVEKKKEEAKKEIETEKAFMSLSYQQQQVIIQAESYFAPELRAEFRALILDKDITHEEAHERVASLVENQTGVKPTDEVSKLMQQPTEKLGEASKALDNTFNAAEANNNIPVMGVAHDQNMTVLASKAMKEINESKLLAVKISQTAILAGATKDEESTILTNLAREIISGDKIQDILAKHKSEQEKIRQRCSSLGYSEEQIRKELEKHDVKTEEVLKDVFKKHIPPIDLDKLNAEKKHQMLAELVKEGKLEHWQANLLTKDNDKLQQELDKQKLHDHKQADKQENTEDKKYLENYREIEKRAETSESANVQVVKKEETLSQQQAQKNVHIQQQKTTP